MHEGEGFDYYSVFSLWDTFRAAHPLYTLIEKKRNADFINTFLKQYEQGGRLPVWELASNETDCMIGYHSVSVMADAMAKGITGFDYQKAFEAAKHSAMRDELGLKAYKQNGFISIDDDHESVSKTLEYAYDDWCIAQMAQILNKKSEFDYFMKRSQNWKNLFDSKTGFIRPKKNGGWEKPFDPKEVNNNFTEGNAWQYTFFVPQDIPGMIEAYGGKQKFEAKLDEMFNSESKTTGREQVDVTGLIGQYAHGNEPSHHMAYLYNYIGKPEKTADKVHYILDNFYKNAPDGLIGNEDCGQMSAWYVLSSMGIYAVTPGAAVWETTVPAFSTIKVNFENKTSKIISKASPAIDLVYFDADSDADRFAYVGMLESDVEKMIPVPVISAKSKSFQDKMIIEISSQNPVDKIYYMLSVNNDASKDKDWRVYTEPLVINQTTQIQAKINNNGKESNSVSAQFYKKPNNYTISTKSKYNSQYTAGGDEGLIDGINGDENWRKGEWQGYQNQDFEAVIDLQEVRDVSSFSATFLQDSRSWILMPAYVQFYTSEDNINYKIVDSPILHTVNPKDDTTRILPFTINQKVSKVRYVKVFAKNFGKLPSWHQGFGGDAFIFIDEITIK